MSARNPSGGTTTPTASAWPTSPCVVRGRNHFGNLRIGASGGSDTRSSSQASTLGYEHNYVLRSGWVFFWQVKGDVMIKGADLLRAGVGLGVKLPIR